jgi:plastocyanin
MKSWRLLFNATGALLLGGGLLACNPGAGSITEPTTGNIIATIKDESGAPVMGTKIRIINSSIIWDLVSDSAGIVTFGEVTVGQYDLNVYAPQNYVLAPGQSATTPITISDGQTLRPQITLRSAPGAPGSPGVGYIKVVNFEYEPDVLHIKRGATVTWQNLEADLHTVTSSLGNELNSGNLTRQKRYEHTFSTPGIYEYRCVFHEVMVGTIIVEE